MKISEKQFKLLTIFFSIPLALFMIYGYLKAFQTTADGFLRWQECACILHGIYPMDIVLGRIPAIEEFGVFDSSITNTPWSYLLTNILYPGFLPWSAARIWSICLFTACAALCALFLYKKLFQSSQNKLLTIFLCIQFFVHFGWGSSLNKLNNGMFCVLAITAVLILMEYYPHTTKNEILIAFLMVIAMLKPQVALLFYIPLLIQKYYKSIFLSGGILLASWLGLSAIVNISPLTILLEQFQAGVDSKYTAVYVYCGILDFLTMFGIKASLIMLIEAAIFIPVVFILCYRFRHTSTWVIFSIPALFMLFWCYHHNTEVQIVGILMVCIAYLLFTEPTLSKIEQAYCIFLLLFNLCPISYLYYEISPLIPFFQRILYLFGLILILKHYRSYTSLKSH